MAGIWTNANEFKELSKDAATLSQELATWGKTSNLYRMTQVLPNPDFILRKAGRTQAVYSEVLADPRVTACAASRSSGTLALEYEIASNETQGSIVDFVNETFQNLPMYDIMSDILQAPLWGQKILEVVWNLSNGKIIPDRIVAKPNQWFVYHEEELRMLTIDNPYEGIPLPDYKFIVARSKATYENPYGEALLSLCFWPVIFKKGGIRFWVQFTERFGMPWVVGHAPSGSSQEKMNEYLAQIIGLRQGGATVIDDNAKLDLLEPKGSGSVDAFKELTQYCNDEIAISLLGQNLTTQVHGGSFAAAQAHMGVRKDIVQSDKRIVENALNTLIKWICILNFGESNFYPQFKLWEDEQVDKTLSERDGILSKDCGVKFTPTYFEKAYGFDEEDIASIGQPETTSGTPLAGSAQFSEAAFTQTQNAIDEFMSTLPAAELQKQADGILKPIIDLIEESKDYQEVLSKLAQTYPKMDSTGIQEMLSRAMFVSEYLGRAEVNRE
jgi:phage gp29-like protein